MRQPKVGIYLVSVSFVMCPSRNSLLPISFVSRTFNPKTKQNWVNLIGLFYIYIHTRYSREIIFQT